MKKLIFTVLVAAIGTTAIAKNTGGNATKVSVQTNFEESLMNIVYADDEPSLVAITIYDDKGKEVLKDKVRNSNGFDESYDLSKLSSGIYTLSMADEQGEFYSTSALVNNDHSAVKPAGRAKYQLTFDAEQPQMVHIQIYDDWGRPVYRESLMSNAGFSKVYDLARVQSGHFVFEVKSSAGLETHRL